MLKFSNNARYQPKNPESQIWNPPTTLPSNVDAPEEYLPTATELAQQDLTKEHSHKMCFTVSTFRTGEAKSI
jgi:hypothetical protein